MQTKKSSPLLLLLLQSPRGKVNQLKLFLPTTPIIRKNGASHYLCLIIFEAACRKDKVGVIPTTSYVVMGRGTVQ